MSAFAHPDVRARSVRAGALVVVVPALVIALFVGLLSAGGALPGAQAATWVPTPGVKFNVPRAGDKQYIIERQVVDAINHAVPGSHIRMATFSFDRYPVADALIRARNRGVHVQVLTNGHELPPAQAKLKKAFGTDRAKRTFFYQCLSSCRGQGDILHTKFTLFSQSGGTINTVMLGSANMKTNGTDNQYNDWLTINRAGNLYTTFAQVFAEMAADKWPKAMRISKRFGSHYQLDVMPFPRDQLATPETEWTPARDPIIRLLAPVRCKGAATPSGRTAIRIDMHAWDGERGAMIARRIKALYDAGCDVRLLVGLIPRSIKSILYASTGRGRVPLRSTGFDTPEVEALDSDYDLYSHKKLTMIHGRYGDYTGQRILVTGSSNFQNGGQYGDEIFFRVTAMPNLFMTYMDNWRWLWKYKSHSMP